METRGTILLGLVIVFALALVVSFIISILFSIIVVVLWAVVFVLAFKMLPVARRYAEADRESDKRGEVEAAQPYREQQRQGTRDYIQRQRDAMEENKGKSR
jgi:hypothetical protein